MTKLFLGLAILALSTIACSKSATSKSKHSSDEFAGKWKYFQSYYSIGGPLIYDNILPGKYVVFQTDGKIESNMEFFQPYNRFELIDLTTVMFYGKSPAQMDRLYRFSIDTISHKMNLSPLDFECIEGCGFILKR